MWLYPASSRSLAEGRLFMSATRPSASMKSVNVSAVYLFGLKGV